MFLRKASGITQPLSIVRLAVAALVVELLICFAISVPVHAAGIITLSPSSGTVGSAVTISGSGFNSAGETINVLFDSTTPVIQSFPAASATWSTYFTVPAAVSGTHSITALGSVSGSAVASFTVIPSTEVTTLDASAVTATSATLNGDLISLGSPKANVWFAFGTMAGGPYSNLTTPQSMTAAGSFSTNISGLTLGITYYFKAVCFDSVNPEVSGVEKSFVFTVILRGDANGDGKITIADVTEVERMILGLDPPTIGADANNDGIINMADVTKIERIILGLDIPLVLGAPQIPADHVGRTTCFMCHQTGIAGAPKFPTSNPDHTTFTDALSFCQGCHTGP
jgi:hypothetical protein